MTVGLSERKQSDPIPVSKELSSSVAVVAGGGGGCPHCSVTMRVGARGEFVGRPTGS